MKISLQKIAFAVALTAVSQLACAATIATGAWTTPAKVTSVGLYGNQFRVTTETSDITNSGDASISNGAYWWWATDTLSKEMFSTFLAAQASGKKVQVSYSAEGNNGARRLIYLILSD